jgi:hypothetical protein
MALIKKDYGLVYNTDGSLCTTIRYDDIPFPGVKSFAVEEGTENLVTDQSALSAYSNAVFTNELVQSGNWKGWYKVHVTHSGDYSWVGYLQGILMDVGDTATFSIDFYSEDNKAYPYVTGKFGVGRLNLQGKYRQYLTWTNDRSSSGTEHVYFGLTVDANTDTDITFYYRRYQIEKKPFATSFVDGTRPAGNITVLDNGIVRDFANKGFVIAGWFKRDTTRATSSYFRVWSFTQMGGCNIESDSSHTPHILINDGGTYKTSYFTNTNFLDDLAWHFIVVTYNPSNKTVKGFFDGDFNNSLVLSSGLHYADGTNYALAVGYEYYDYVAHFNGLISNFYVGNYTDQWTDEYIKALYESKSPFIFPSGTKPRVKPTITGY